MSTNLFLTEGGVAGHMSHLYDNRELTFAKLKEIFTAASSGELEGTEKTDGQNLYISYSVKTGQAKAARNKGNIKAGGMSAEELADKFAGRGGLTEAFVESFETFERAVQTLDPTTQMEIFGPDNDIYYNAEVMDPRSPNVVNYDTKSLVIHRAGHGEYDRETGDKTDRDVSKNAKVLEAALIQMQQGIEEDEYNVHINAIRKLETLDADIALHDAIEALGSLQKAAGVSDDATITEFLIARIGPYIANSVPEADQDVHKLIMQRLLKAGVTFNDVVRGLDKELKEKIRAIIKDEKNILQRAIGPLENIVHDFSVEMLRGLESAFILDNEKEVKRLKKEVATAIKTIQQSNNEEAIDILKKQMTKLKSIDNVATASEGFVFDYDGATYKFTGNFAPINQILGIFKYGRGENIPALIDVGGDESEHFGEAFGEGLADVAIIPGAFKPPHKGHLAMIGEYAKKANRVIVFMSPLARKLPNGSEMTFDKAYQLWDAYLKSAELDNVKVLESPVNSPVGATFNFVANEDNNPEWAQEGETVILGVSTKGGDDARFTDKVQEYAKEGVTVLSGKDYAVNPLGSDFVDGQGEPLSATGMRQAIADNDVDAFSEYLPDSLKKSAAKLLRKLAPKSEESISEMIFRMIHETMDENTAASGAVQGTAGSFGKPNTEDVWNKEDEDEEEDQAVEEVFKRLFSRPQNKGSKSNAH